MLDLRVKDALDDGITGGRIYTAFNGIDQYIRVLDHEDIQLKRWAEDGSGLPGISITCTLDQRSSRMMDVESNERSWLFYKIDNEELQYGYAAWMDENSYIHFHIRDNYRDYTISSQAPVVTQVEVQSGFKPESYKPESFLTGPSISTIPPEWHDFTFTYDFTTHEQSIKQDGVTISASGLGSPFSANSGLVGRWLLKESTGTTAQNFVSGGNDGTLANPTWDNAVISGKYYLYFHDTVTNQGVTVPNYEAIQVLKAFTISLWYYPTSTPTTGENDFLVYKNWSNNGSFIGYYRNSGGTVQVVIQFKSDGGTSYSQTVNTTLTNNTWNHLVFQWEGQNGKIGMFVNKVYTPDDQTVPDVSIDTGNTVFTIGDVGLSSSPDGLIYDVQFYNRALSAEEVTGIYNIGIKDTLSKVGLVGRWALNEGGPIGSPLENTLFNSANNPIPNDYVGRWKIFEGTGADVFNSVEGGEDGTISNAIWTAIGLRTYLHFDGSSDFITIPNYSEIQNNNACTISFWYRHQALPNTDHYMVYKGTVASANSWLVYAQSSGYVRLSIWNNSTTRFDTTFNSAFAAGVDRWYHILAKWTLGGTGKVFVDGVRVNGASITGTLDTGSSDLIIGGGTNLAIQGYIYDVVFYDRELSDKESMGIYLTGQHEGHGTLLSGTWEGVPKPPVGRWLITDGVGVNINNSVSGGEDGTIVGDVSWDDLLGDGVKHQLLTDSGGAGGSDRISIPSYSAANYFRAFTVSFWYYPKSLTSAQTRRLVNKNYGGIGEWLVEHQTGNGGTDIKLFLRDNDNVNLHHHTFTNRITEPDRWYHIVVKWQAFHATDIIVDGVTNTSGSVYPEWFLDTENAPIEIGTDLYGVDGYIYDLIIWDREITDAEALWIYQQGRPNTAFNLGMYTPYIRFDENGDKAVIPSYNSVANIDAGTVSIWYYHLGDNSKWRGMTWKGLSDGPSTWLIYVESNAKIRFTTWNDSDTRKDSEHPTAILPYNWYHIVGKWNRAAGTQSITVDGTKTARTDLTGTMDTSQRDINLGRGWLDADFLVGQTHDLCLWNRELTDAEISTLYGIGHPHAAFPTYQDSPPPPPEEPQPITNPFDLLYQVPQSSPNVWQTLHQLSTADFTQEYTVSDGVPISGGTVPFTVVYGPVATEGGGGSQTVAYDVSQNSSSHLEVYSGSGGDGTHIAVRAVTSALIGKVVTKIAVRGRKDSPSSGTVFYKIWKAAGGTVDLGNHSPSSLPDNDALGPEVDASSNTYTTQSGDRIGLLWTGATSDNDFEISQNDSSGDGNDTWSSNNGTSWSNESTDAGFKIWVGGGGGNFWQFTSSLTRVGQYISSASSSLIGKRITRVKAYLRRDTNSSGTISAKIYKASGGSVTIDTMSHSSVTTSATPVLYTLQHTNPDTQTYTLQNGDWIGIEWPNGSTFPFALYAYGNSSVGISNSHVRTYSGSWSDQTSYDFAGEFAEGGWDAPDIDPYLYLNDVYSRAAVHLSSSGGTNSALVGKTITKISPKLSKVGSPTGILTCVIRNSSGTTVTNFGTRDVDTGLTTSDVQYNFTNVGNTRAFALNDRISFEYSGGTATDYVRVLVRDNAYDTSRTHMDPYDGTWGVTTWDLSGQLYSGGGNEDPNSRTRVGIKLVDDPPGGSVLQQNKLTKFEFYAKKVNSPSGSAWVRVRRGSDDAIQATLGEITMGQINTSLTTLTVENLDNTYFMQPGDRLMVEYSDAGDTTNYIQVLLEDANVADSTNTFLTKFNDLEYDDNTGYDLCGKVWTGGDTYTPAPDEIPPQSPYYYTHDLLISAGGYDPFTPSYFTNTFMQDFRFYTKRIISESEALNKWTNKHSISNIGLGNVAVCGHITLPANP